MREESPIYLTEIADTTVLATIDGADGGGTWHYPPYIVEIEASGECRIIDGSAPHPLMVLHRYVTAGDVRAAIHGFRAGYTQGKAAGRSELAAEFRRLLGVGTGG